MFNVRVLTSDGATRDLARKNHDPTTFRVRLANDNPFARGPGGNIKFILLIKLSAGDSIRLPVRLILIHLPPRRHNGSIGQINLRHGPTDALAVQLDENAGRNNVAAWSTRGIERLLTSPCIPCTRQATQLSQRDRATLIVI